MDATAPKPPRRLGAHGRRIWDRYAGTADAEALLLAAELADERHKLRTMANRTGDPAQFRALRAMTTELHDQLRSFDRAASWDAYDQRRADT